MNRDSIDLGKDNVKHLFRKMLFPTLLGMVSLSAVTAIDGIFIGRGVGSEGIAAVNICVPLLALFTGLGLMLGVGCSVVAAVHLADENEKAARINVTQALLCATVVSLVISAAIVVFPHHTARLLGSSATLEPLVVDYLIGFIPAIVLQLWSMIGLFVIRLDGKPQLAMWCNIIGGGANVVLDWIFIFPLGMGVLGAAIATAISVGIGGIIAIVYIAFLADRLRLYRLKSSIKSIRLTLRNLRYQSAIGFSALLGELTLAVLIFIDNYVIMKYLGDAGVGAFGIACYYCPVVFMVGGAIAQSAQPIISYNMNIHPERALEAQKLSLFTAFVFGAITTIAFQFWPEQLVQLFLNEGDVATEIGVAGMPLFALGFLFYILNLTAIGYYQSVKRIVPATIYALLRGLVLLIPAFLVLPRLLGTDGIWLAMPVAEFFTLCAITMAYVVHYEKNLHRRHSKQ